jgi:hypothetical protein
VSILYEASQTDAFLAKHPKGLNGKASQSYLMVSLRNQLLYKQNRNARVATLTGDLLDSLELPSGRLPRFAVSDATSIAEEVLAMLDDEEVAELCRHLGWEWEGGQGPHAGSDPGLHPDPSGRSQRRRVASFKGALANVAAHHGLVREEMREVLSGIHAILTGEGLFQIFPEFLAGIRLSLLFIYGGR